MKQSSRNREIVPQSKVKAKISNIIQLNELTWLIQPTAVTMMRYDYTLNQTKIFVTIIDKMQESIQNIIKNQKPYYQTTLFSDDQFETDGNSIYLTIGMSDFGINRKHYDQLKDALRTLVAITVETPVKDVNGRKWHKFQNLCQAYIPDKKYVTEVIIKIEKDMALRLVNMDFGYHKIAKELIYNSTNMYTPRLYMFICSWKHQKTYKILTSEFRAWLCLENKYSRFNDFVKRVIDPSQEELRKKSELGLCDCYFDWHPVYDNNQRKSGEPKYLQFTITEAPKVLTERQLEELSKKQSTVNDMLITHYGLVRSQAKEISMHVTLDNFQETLVKLTELREYIQKNHQTITNSSSYVYSSMKKYFGGE